MDKIVLMYHDIVTSKNKTSGFQNESAFQYKVEEQQFREVVKFCEPSKVLLSFDDGGVSFLTMVAPILEQYGHTGIFFITTNYIGTPGFLNAEQIMALEARGHIIGSHSCSHPHNMAKLSDETIEKEWINSIKVLQEILGHKVEYASIPNGYSSKTVIEKAKKAGIRYLYTSTPTDKIRHKGGVDIIGRYVIHDKMTVSDVGCIVNSKFTRQKKHLKWFFLEAIKIVLGNKYDKVKALVFQSKK